MRKYIFSFVLVLVTIILFTQEKKDLSVSLGTGKLTSSYYANRLEKLSGKLKEFYSIRVNDQ